MRSSCTGNQPCSAAVDAAVGQEPSGSCVNSLSQPAALSSLRPAQPTACSPRWSFRFSPIERGWRGWLPRRHAPPGEGEPPHPLRAGLAGQGGARQRAAGARDRRPSQRGFAPLIVDPLRAGPVARTVPPTHRRSGAEAGVTDGARLTSAKDDLRSSALGASRLPHSQGNAVVNACDGRGLGHVRCDSQVSAGQDVRLLVSRTCVLARATEPEPASSRRMAARSWPRLVAFDLSRTQC